MKITDESDRDGDPHRLLLLGCSSLLRTGVDDFADDGILMETIAKRIDYNSIHLWWKRYFSIVMCWTARTVSSKKIRTSISLIFGRLVYFFLVDVSTNCLLLKDLSTDYLLLGRLVYFLVDKSTTAFGFFWRILYANAE